MLQWQTFLRVLEIQQVIEIHPSSQGTGILTEEGRPQTRKHSKQGNQGSADLFERDKYKYLRLCGP